MLYVLTALSVAAQVAASAPAPPELRGEDLMKALRSGGYTLLVRHARTDRSIPTMEQPAYTPPLRADQRNLTADGERDVRMMAEVVRRFELPIGEVLSSPVYRCRETADAFGTPSITMTLRRFPTTAETAALVAAAPKPGTNRVLVTHHFVIEDHVPGIDPGDIGESEVAVVRPTGDGGVALVGRITLGDWQVLAGEMPAAAATRAATHGAPAATHGAPAATHGAPAATHGAPAAPHGAPAARAHVSVPDTRAGRLAARYIEAFNSGDADRMRTFIETWLVAHADRPTQTRLQTYGQLFREHGALMVFGVHESTPDSVTLQVHSKQGEVFVQVIAAPAPSDRARSVSFGVRGGGHR